MKQQILSLGMDSLIYGVGSVITRFIGLLLLPIFTAYLSPEEYGVLAMLALLSIVAQPVFSLGLGAAMGPSYFEGNNPETKATAVWTAFSINLATASILVMLGWVFPIPLGRLVMLSADHASLVSLSLTGCALTILATAFTLRVQFEKQARLYVSVTIVTALTAIVLSVLTVVFLGWGVRGMVIGQLSGNIVTLLIFLLIALKATRPAFSKSTLKELLRLGLPLVPGFAFLFILMHANKYILEWHAGLEAVGIYSVGFNIGTVISIVTGGLAMAWYPFFMSYMERQSEATVLFGRIFTYYTFGVGLLCLMFFIFSEPLVTLLTQEAFHDSAKVVGFVALAYLFQGAFGLLLPGLYYLKELRYVSLIQGIAAVASIAINYYLITNYGILGAAIGLALGNLFMTGVLYAWNQLNEARYPAIAYEWRRIGLFLSLFVLVPAMQVTTSTHGLLGELIESAGFAVIAILLFFMLLSSREREVVVVKLRLQ